jgi:subtilisin family serine protease
MKKYLALSGIILASLLFAPFFTATTAAKDEKFKKSANKVPGRYIVVFNETTIPKAKGGQRSYQTEAESYQVAGDYAANIDHIYDSAVNGFSAEMSETSAKALSMDPRISYVEEDAVAMATAEQSAAPWALDRIDQHALPLNASFQYAATGVGVHAYIIDSGIRTTHQEFGGRALNSIDVTNDGQNGNDCNGHGTHVAGIVGSSTYGVAKNVTLHSVRVLRCDGTGYLSDVLAGVNWVTANRITPAVANISLIFSGISPSLDNAITTSIASGVTYSIAAGNSNQDACLFSPARVPNALTVGSIDSNDARPGYSNQGPCLDLYAPGNGIMSLSNGDDVSARSMSGTSMAAPHVAGVAALYLESHPSAQPATVSQEILNATTNGVVWNVDGVSANKLLFSSLGNEPAPAPASVTIIKQVQTASGGTASSTAFSYAASNLGAGNFSLVDNDSPPADRYVDPNLPNVEATNDIVVTESAMSGWALDSIQCVETAGNGLINLQNSTVDVANKRATIRVEQGESVTCTFKSTEVIPAAAPASLSGRVVDAKARGVNGVQLVAVNVNTGASTVVSTNSSGNYAFSGLMTTNVYRVSSGSKGVTFTPVSQTVALNQSLSGIDFVTGATTNKRR